MLSSTNRPTRPAAAGCAASAAHQEKVVWAKAGAVQLDAGGPAAEGAHRRRARPGSPAPEQAAPLPGMRVHRGARAAAQFALVANCASIFSFPVKPPRAPTATFLSAFAGPENRAWSSAMKEERLANSRC